MARRARTVAEFLQDLSDDIKDFIDDELIDRGRRVERDVRRTGRDLFDYNGLDDDRRPERGRNGDEDVDIDELRAAVKALGVQLARLTEKK